MENLEFKGTKGVWIWDFDCVLCNTQDMGNIICEKPIARHSSINWEANAKLIACAPEMLEMLCKLKDRFEYFNDNVSVIEIEQLIKKATK